MCAFFNDLWAVMGIQYVQKITWHTEQVTKIVESKVYEMTSQFNNLM